MDIRTEKEKMLAGELYNCLDPALEVDRQKAKLLMNKYNHPDNTEDRQKLLHQMLGGIGENVTIWTPFFCSYGKNTYLGNNVFLNYMCTILDCNQVRIGNHVMVGPSVHMYTAAHHLKAKERNMGLEVAMPITIEDNVWIGGGAIILPGVSIGQNAVVGAGAIVTRDVPPDTVVAGNPARVIRKIEQD